MIYRSPCESSPRAPQTVSVRGVLAAFLLVLTLPPAFAEAQSLCEEELNQADSLYRIGRFEEALVATAACLEQNPARRVASQVLALEAKIHIARDDLEAAARSVAALLRADEAFTPDVRDPPRFQALVVELQQGTTTVKVSSVSKTPESLREAPATVVVVTGEEIERRGYLDLEAVLHDLPGFDISRSNGTTYSAIYQRGYRSDNTDRTLFMVDGVEENDVWSNIAYISRQFSLSDIDRVEVVYGPASTLYGANAYAGVINVLTKNADGIVEKGKRLGVRSQVTAGDHGTRVFDTTIAGRSKHGDITWSLVGRIFQSDEPDLSGFEDWNYDPEFYARPSSAAIYGNRLGFDPAAVGETRSVLGYIDEICGGDPACIGGVNASPFLNVSTSGIALSTAGLQRVAALDQALLARQLGGEPIGFSDPTDDFLLSGKLELANFVFGFRTWSRDEGATPFGTDLRVPGTDNGHFWNPRQTALFLKYERDLRDDLNFSIFARYKRHDVNDGSHLQFSNTYFGGQLDVLDLVSEDAGAPPELTRSVCDPSSPVTQPCYSSTFFHLLNNQLRTEMALVYLPSDKLSVVGGLEFRDSSLQGGYVLSFGDVTNPATNGNPSPVFPGGNRFQNTDLGLFAQATYRASDRWKLVAGGRFDNNQISNDTGYGTVFNPRFAVVYMPGDFVFKGIYAEAFKDASNFQKYAVLAGQRDTPNLDLQPEKVKNIELSAGWQGMEDFSAEVSVYDASYSQVVELAAFQNTTRFQNTGSLEVFGIQANASWKLKNYSLFGNYTFTDPKNTEPRDSLGNALDLDELRTGDIARHQINLGVNAEFRQRYNFNLRMNYVGEKPTGEGTTVVQNDLTKIDSYTVFHASLKVEDLLPNASLQLIINNLFDSEYYHPGPRTADGVTFPNRSPQPERSVYLRFLYSF